MATRIGWPADARRDAFRLHASAYYRTKAGTRDGLWASAAPGHDALAERHIPIALLPDAGGAGYHTFSAAPAGTGRSGRGALTCGRLKHPAQARYCPPFPNTLA